MFLNTTRLTFLIALCCFLFPFQALEAQSDYSNFANLSKRVNDLQKTYGDLVSAQSIAKTKGGKDIWVLTIGSGDVDGHPAIGVVGGVDGSHLISTELAIGFAESLLRDAKKDDIKSLLEETTFYVIPNMSPDASEQYFSKLKYERKGNANTRDDDRDGRIDEDPFEDLDRDGMIRWIRVEDQTGAWKKHAADERIMVKADKKKGETGLYHYFTEGIDNDKDGRFNEDGVGGVHFNKNMAYQFPYFSAGAGEYPVSESESKALLDFLYDRWNVFALVTFGPSDNLSAPMKYQKAAASQRVVSGILEKDAAVNKMISDKYNTLTADKDHKKKDKDGKAISHKGGFMEWGYFHYGRFSFGTPGWKGPQWQMPKDSLEKLKYPANEDKNPEVDFLRWAEQMDLKDAFAEWKKIKHPDFPGKTVEVGGITPFLMSNPPYQLVGDLVKQQSDFIISLARMKPSVKVVNLKIEAMGNGMTRLTVDVYNNGALPTLSELGTRNKWLRKVKVELSPANGQAIVSGKKVQLLNTIESDSFERLSWLINGKGNLNIKAGASQVGFDVIDVELKE